MPCSCQDQPKTEGRSLAQDALWALAFAATRRDARALPPLLRGMTPDEALAILTPLEPAGLRTGWAAFHLMFIAAGIVARNDPRLEILNSIKIVPTNVLIFLQILAGIFQSSERAARQFLSGLQELAIAGLPPCGGQSATGTYDSTLKSTNLKSRVVVYRSLNEVAGLLDPQRWDECSELFLRTCRVSKAPGCEPECISPAKDDLPGADWEGIIYERAGAGPQEIENLLSVKYNVTSDRVNECVDVEEVRVKYSLHRSISHRLGGWESAGLFRRNAGEVIAKPIKYDIPNGEAGADCTEMFVTKDVEFGRITSWRGSSVVDYGDLCNYLAPALLTLWVTNLAMIVPCCGK
jgi:hypothetical protein